MLRRRVRERAPAVILALGLAAMAGLVTVVSVSAGANVWTRLGGPNIIGGNVTALAVEPTTSGTAYAVVNPPGSESIYWGQVGKVFKTTDGGATWTPVHTPQVRLESLAVTGTEVYVAGWGSGGMSSIYRSDDGGASWSGVYTTTGSWNNFYALAIDPTDADNVYAAGMETTVADPYAYYGAVYSSTNGGVSWTQALTVPNSAYFYSLAVNPLPPRSCWLVDGEGVPAASTAMTVGSAGPRYTQSQATTFSLWPSTPSRRPWPMPPVAGRAGL